jgi:hypothetical protein
MLDVSEKGPSIKMQDSDLPPFKVPGNEELADLEAEIAFSRLQHSRRKLGGRPSSASKVRLRFGRSGPSTPKTPPIELHNSLESPPPPLEVGAFTTKTTKKDGAGGCFHHQNREKRRGRLLLTTIFNVFVLATTKCVSFFVATKSESFCHHQNRE